MPEVNEMKLRELREAQVLSLSMLEKRSGVSRETILAIEQGKRKRVQPGTIHKLAAALGVDPRELVS